VGINDSGQVVGYSARSGAEHAFLWDAVNGMQDLGTLPGGTESFATGINNSGQVVGRSGIAGRFPAHAFLWDATHGMQDLGTLPGGNFSEARGINNSGQVVGYSDAAGTQGYGHAFLWQNGVMTDLGTLPGDGESYAYGISDSGQVVGESRGFPTHAFLWDAVHGMQNLGTLSRDAQAYGINSNGQVVGTSEIFDPDFGINHAFVWQDGTVSDLNDLIPLGSVWTLVYAYAINNAGQIALYGSNGHTAHAVLLTPDSSALTAPGGTKHFTRNDTQAVLLADSTFTAADTGVHPSSPTLATLGDQTLTGSGTTEARRIGAATVPATSNAAAPAGRTVHSAMDALFASSHRANASVSASDGEVNELERGVSLLPKL
jgi:probable HAF family extracellular repeat protein